MFGKVNYCLEGEAILIFGISGSQRSMQGERSGILRYYHREEEGWDSAILS